MRPRWPRFRQEYGILGGRKIPLLHIQLYIPLTFVWPLVLITEPGLSIKKGERSVETKFIQSWFKRGNLICCELVCIRLWTIELARYSNH